MSATKQQRRSKHSQPTIRTWQQSAIKITNEMYNWRSSVDIIMQYDPQCLQTNVNNINECTIQTHLQSHDSSWPEVTQWHSLINNFRRGKNARLDVTSMQCLLLNASRW